MLKRFRLSRKTTKESQNGNLNDGAGSSNVASSDEDARRARPSLQGRSTTDSVSALSVSSPSDRRASSQSPNPAHLGLHVLHAPELRAVDIIFVHGLGGHSHHTWTRDHDPAFFWPESWLPLEPDMDAARVLTFGYNASWRGAGKSISNIGDFAKDLLYDMRFGKDETGSDLDLGSRPIIFVVHSMGGLVVKKAYLLGMHDQNYKKIIASVSAIIFLSTPHRGSNLAETLNRVISATFQSSKSFLSDLSKSSAILEELNEQFRHLAPSLSIWSFYETLATSIGPRKIMVLEKDSSILGYPSEISKPLQADHREVCKYRSPNDSNYISVRNAIKSLVSMFRSTSANQADEVSAAEEALNLKELFRNCTTSEDDYNLIRRRWIPDTCTWFLQKPEVMSWMEAAGASILWYSAPPGTGKSVLSTFMINHLRESGKKCQYFFFRHSDRQRSSAASALKGIALQTAKDMPAFRKALSSLSADSLGLDSEDPHLIWRNVFEDTLTMSCDADAYWVIDALDECDTPKLLVDCFRGISRLSVPVKLLVLSRNTDTISVSFDRLSRSIPVITLDVSVQTHEDIETFICQEIRHMRGSEGFLRKLKDTIVSRSGGNFLWTKLVLEEIMDCHTEESIQEVLDEIPDDMFELYQRMEENLIKSTRKSNIPLIKALLEWTVCSHRALTLQEMSEALQPEFSRIIDLSRTIKDTCGHFLQISDQGRISILHHTAREYFLRTSNSRFFIDEKKVHEKLFQKAILGLSQPSLKTELLQRQHTLQATQPFVFYAAVHWPYHLGKCDIKSPAVFDSLTNFLSGTSVLSWIHALSLLRRIDVLVKSSKVMTSFANNTRKRDASRNPMLHRLSDLQLLDDWADDLTKLVGKFGQYLTVAPNVVYDVVPALCPGKTAIRRQFYGPASASLDIQISGLEDCQWDDNLGRLALPAATSAWKVCCAGRFLAVLGSTGVVHLWNSSSLMEAGTIHHQEIVTGITLNRAGSKLVTCGTKTTKMWTIPTGDLILTIANPTYMKAMDITFANDDASIIVGGDDKVIRLASCSEPDKGWQILHPSLLKELPLEGAIYNSPMCLAFSSDNAYVGVSYRGAPLSVWRLSDGRYINRCKRAKDATVGKRRPSTNWFAVDRFTWNPVTSHVIGIYKDGCVFKWHPLTDEVSEAQRAADEVAASPNGKLFATSSSNGSVRVWDFAHFCVIYQLSSTDLVIGLTFSPDSRRFYDVRGADINIWEPKSVTRFHEEEMRISDDSNSEDKSSTTISKYSEQHVSTFESVTAIAFSPDGQSYCAGYADGTVLLFPNHQDEGVELARFYNFLDITHISWSLEGRFVAVADLAGDIAIKSVALNSNGETAIESLPDVKIDLQGDTLRHIIFNEGGSRVMFTAVRTAVTCVVDISSGKVTTHHLSDRNQMWFHHPRDASMLLAIGSRAQVYSWDAFQLNEVNHGRPLSRKASFPEDITSSGLMPHGYHSGSEAHIITDAWLCRDQNNLLVQMPKSTSHGSLGMKVLEVLEIDFLNTHGSVIEAQPLLIPPEISEVAFRPLGILPGSRLIFLDRNLWLCCYTFKGSNAMTQLYQRYYFIPRDWVGSHSLTSCVMSAEGTLYWPKDDRVIRIRCDFDLAKPIELS